MPRTVSATEAKNRLGAVVDWVVQNHDEVIIESHGAPRVVIMSVEEYTQLQIMKEQARRLELVARLERLRDRVRARNTDLTEEEADAIADRLTRDAVQAMIDDGRIRYQL